MIDSLSHAQFIDMVVTLWAIWYARRKAIHENEFHSPLSTHLFMKRFIAELDICKPPKPLHRPIVQNAEPRASVWIPPPMGVAKLKVDGAVARNLNFGAYSDVCRDSAGLYLGASAINSRGVTDPTTLEALACHEALSCASDLALNRVIV